MYKLGLIFDPEQNATFVCVQFKCCIFTRSWLGAGANFEYESLCSIGKFNWDACRQLVELANKGLEVSITGEYHVD